MPVRELEIPRGAVARGAGICVIRAIAWRLATVAALVAAALLLPGCVTTLARGETAVQPCTIDASAADSYARRFLMYHRCDWQQ